MISFATQFIAYMHANDFLVFSLHFYDGRADLGGCIGVFSPADCSLLLY